MLDLQDMERDSEDLLRDGRDLNQQAEGAVNRLTENVLVRVMIFL